MKVSVIMPAFNAEKYIGEAIKSVLDQSHRDIELLIINDGSTDDTASKIDQFDDERIQVFHQENSGVSAARNLGLDTMSGEFFCFLDADDKLPLDSIQTRLEKFLTNPDLDFVDGTVLKSNKSLSRTLSRWEPGFRGEPLNDLLSLSGNTFFGPTWLIKRDVNIQYKFKIGLTHGEDLLFYISICNGKNYDYVLEPILNYRIHSQSAMQDLKKLGEGYETIYHSLDEFSFISIQGKKRFRKKYRSIMLKSYLRNGHILETLKLIFK